MCNHGSKIYLHCRLIFFCFVWIWLECGEVYPLPWQMLIVSYFWALKENTKLLHACCLDYVISCFCPLIFCKGEKACMVDYHRTENSRGWGPMFTTTVSQCMWAENCILICTIWDCLYHFLSVCSNTVKKMQTLGYWKLLTVFLRKC